MSVIYPNAKKRFVTKLLGWANDGDGTLYAQLLDATYTYSDAHEFLTSIPAGSKVGTAVALNALTAIVDVDGYLAVDADDVAYPALAGDIVTQILIYKWSGSDATSPLIVLRDDVVGLPLTPSGADATIVWDALGVFRWGG